MSCADVLSMHNKQNVNRKHCKIRFKATQFDCFKDNKLCKRRVYNCDAITRLLKND